MIKRIGILLLVFCALFSFARADRLPDEQLLSYFDDALFIGDSQMRMLGNYIKPLQKKDPAFFRNAHFYTAYNYQLGTAAKDQVLSNRVNLTVKGRERTMYQIAQDLKPPRLFFLAGMNDRIAFHMDRAERYIDKIMENMAKYLPDTQMYFLSIPPITQKFEKEEHARKKIDAYNEFLEEKCRQLGAIYIDIHTDLKDEEGFMLKGISSDGMCHLNEKGNAIVVQTLLNFVQSQYDAGLWAPEQKPEEVT